MDKFVLESDRGDQWFVCEWISKSNFHILKVFYSKGKAQAYLNYITF